VADEHVQLAEGIEVKQLLHSLAGGHLSPRMLAVNAGLTTAQAGLLAHLVQLLGLGINGHDRPPFIVLDCAGIHTIP